MNRITIVLPWPDSRLMPNRKNGKHWSSTASAKVSARESGMWAAKEAIGLSKPELAKRIPARITFVAPNNRKRDLDNLLGAMKHALDGVAASLGIDDSQFRPLTLDDGLDKEKKGFVMLELG